MKAMILVLVSLFSVTSFATFDMQGEATIVVESYYEDSGYHLKTVPTDMCVGVLPSSLALAITKPVTIKSNYGCGSGMIHDTQINAATCAKVEAEEVDNPDGSYNQYTVAVTMDISGCGKKAADKNFVKALTQAIYNTLNSNGYQIVKFN